MSIPSWARKGVKVVCVGRDKKPGEPERLHDRGYRLKPTRGETYEISRLVAHDPYGWFVVLVGFPDDLAFHIEGFRPLVNDADDAEIEAQIYRKKHHRATRRVGEDA